MARRLPPGVYDLLVTRAVEAALTQLPANRLRADVLDLDDGTDLVARHVFDEVTRALASLGGAEAASKRVELANLLLDFLREQVSQRDDVVERVASPPRVLQAVYADQSPPRTRTPLGSSSLLTGALDEPRLGAELEQEIATADRIDALISFVTWEGVRRLEEAFASFARRGGRLRLLTTTYTGATDAEAIERLAALPGAEVRVSYDGRRTRLHAKAWIFHRATGFSTAYVGSANLSRAALGGGLEWTLKLSHSELPHLLAKCEGAFETLWNDGEFEVFAGTPEDLDRLRKALAHERGGRATTELSTFFATLRPYPFQRAILERLEAERAVHGRFRNLVVAATGTGKTLIAAFDYQRETERLRDRPRLLFLAHRRELLVQAREAFRHVLLDHAFGEMLTERDEPRHTDHLFATVQSLRSRGLLDRLGGDHWRFAVVDECHHTPAPSFDEVVVKLAPRVLLGLTATPERTDGADLLRYFDGRIAAEIRLWHALDRQLLAPFEYHGLSDGTDLRAVTWSRGGYAADSLERVYTGDHHRARLVLEQFRRLRGRPGEARALGFCVSVAHADFMASRANERGIRALAVHGASTVEVRQSAPGRLQRREVNVLFTCDLYNEGVDLPFVDTLLLLRPTTSVTVFLQQLGRGLRACEGKTSCLVLDFIGQHRREYRFDAVLTALTGVPRGRLREAVEQGFPTLPSGCHLRLDREAQTVIVESLRQTLKGGARELSRELRALAQLAGDDVTLGAFLASTGRELDEVYTPQGSFTTLRRLADLAKEPEAPDEARVARRLRQIVHVDEPARLALYRRWARSDLRGGDLDAAARRQLLMLGYALFHEPERRVTVDEIVALPTALPAIARELDELFEVLADRVALASMHATVPGWTLQLHRRYGRREVLAGCGFWDESRKAPMREGVVRLDDGRELFFVTLVKSEKRFTPSTRYRDYAISPLLFHWQSQSGTSDQSPTGRRYAERSADPSCFQLFVRRTDGEPYVYLGPVTYVSHEGSRPMSITWRLEHPMPGALFLEYATLAA